MIRQNLVMAIRSFATSKSYSLLNILGLTLGITCALTILLYVYDELTYDHNHENIANIYRLNSGWRSMTDGTSNMYASAGYVLGDVLQEQFPEVDNVTRFQRFWDMRIEKPETGDHFPEFIYAAQPNISDFFTLPLIKGDWKTALAKPNALVVSEKTALKYFNRVDVIGEHLRWLRQDTLDMEITAVMKDYPDNTQIKIDMLTALVPPSNMRDEWFEYRYYTFFTLAPNADVAKMEARIGNFTKGYADDIEKEIGFTQEHAMTPFSKIHLYSRVTGELEPNGNATYVYIFLLVGMFILLMACINFMNLATARSMKRAKEIGVRKVVGALKGQLVRQFLGEALLMTLVAAAASALAVKMLLPIVNDFSGKRLELFDNPVFWTLMMAIVFLVTLCAGAYPAFFLAAFKPVDTLKGTFRTSDKGIWLRKGLVIFQFCISIALIAGTLIILRHLDFLRSKDLGFSKDKIITINGATKSVKEQLLNIPGVSHASLSNRVPGYSVGGRTIINGWDEKDPQVVLGQLAVDHDFIALYDLELLAGRAFSRDFPSDDTEAFLVNEAALERLKIASPEEAIGHELWLQEWGGKKGRIVGVLKNFHFIGVNAEIEPFSMFILPGGGRFLSVKIASDDLPGVIARIEAVYKETVPGRPFEFAFLDESFDKQYQAEDRFMFIFSAFAGIAIFIGCLGLYGLAMFMAEQRTKEVGVRKILGASQNTILFLLTADFLKLVGISFCIAVPLAYFGMEKWLSAFPYREEIDPLIFAVTGCAVIVISFVTVGYQARRAATMNPAKTLRSE